MIHTADIRGRSSSRDQASVTGQQVGEKESPPGGASEDASEQAHLHGVDRLAGDQVFFDQSVVVRAAHFGVGDLQ